MVNTRFSRSPRKTRFRRVHLAKEQLNDLAEKPPTTYLRRILPFEDALAVSFVHVKCKHVTKSFKRPQNKAELTSQIRAIYFIMDVVLSLT